VKEQSERLNPRQRSCSCRVLFKWSSIVSRVLLVTLILLLVGLPVRNHLSADPQERGLSYECYPTTSNDARYNLETGDPLSAATGEYHFFMDLFGLGGVLPLDLLLYCGSVGTAKHRLDGLPFSFFTNQRLTVEVIKYIDPPTAWIEKGLSEEIGFHQTATGWEAYDLEDIRYQLKETKDYYYFLDPIDELVYTFRKEFENEDRVIGFLITVQDRNGNTLTYKYPSTGVWTG